MIEDIDNGKIERVIIKDMSRLGRDYLQVGMYTEIIFPQKDTHFIAVNDSVDSTKGMDDFTPFRNIINEWYAKDTSKKVRTVKKAKGMAVEQILLENIKQLTKFVTEYENEFVQMIIDTDMKQRNKHLVQKKRQLKNKQHRIDELDDIFRRIYEDNLRGKLSDDRFNNLSKRYESEQKDLKTEIAEFRTRLNRAEDESVNVKKFIDCVKKYTDIQELTPEIIHEFIDRMIVHAADKSSVIQLQTNRIKSFLMNNDRSIGYSAFDNCDSLSDVYYNGSENQWNNITIGERNGSLTTATIHYNWYDPCFTVSDNTVTNTDSAKHTADIIIPKYTDGVFAGFETCEEVTFAAGETKTFTVPEGGKLFVWDSLDGMRPLTVN